MAAAEQIVRRGWQQAGRGLHTRGKKKRSCPYLAAFTRAERWLTLPLIYPNPFFLQGANVVTLAVSAIDYRCEDRKKVVELRDDIGAIRYVLTPSFRKPRSSPPKKRTVQPGDAFEDTAF
jgi:hypothetical protein